MKRLGLTLLAGLAGAGSALGQAPPPRGDAAHGKAVYTAYGCWQCHGYQGQGANAGPRLAPGPLPFDAVARQLRKPRGTMPIYTHKTTSDQDVADIYAYLLSIPKGRTADQIPLLSGKP